MREIRIRQGDNSFLQTTKTVDWLVANTSVSVFDPVKFEGYQREINEIHCKKIVKYLEAQFYLPTPIICACDETYDPSTFLRIVDGQHRVHAFKELKKQNPSRYSEIKNYELSVIVMENVDVEIEIDTFITINKTSKRVDTSLAYILKNKINVDRNSENLTISKIDYLAVELAVKFSDNYYWENKISFTGPTSNKGPETISLNAFVKATRRLIGQLDRKGIINITWNNKEEIDKCLNSVEKIVDNLWSHVMDKWPSLFHSGFEKLRIIQGPIGYSSITRFIANEIKDLHDKEVEEIKMSDSLDDRIYKWIDSVDLIEDVWLPGNRFSKFTSESGYNIVAAELKESAGL
ncbi:DGQHR domain-containing protein [Enterococcus thailandicus]|uniref:DGQHR domain-containing protein n=1 Tax=Enterococcus TaxID=1350 RepID=UPI0032E40F23